MSDPPKKDTSFKRMPSGLYAPHSHRSEMPEQFFTPLRPDDFSIILDGLHQFAANPDVLRIWEFDREAGALQGLQFPPGASRLAHSDCWVVCPYVPGRLIIHSPEALRAGRFTFGVAHSVLFDSNLYDLIVRFVESPTQLPAKTATEVRNLLQAIIARKYDFQIVPYLIEAHAKTPGERTRDYSLRAVRAILKLHAMDKEYFRATGFVRLDQPQLDAYEEALGTSDFDIIATKQLESYGELSCTPPAVDVALLLLIKLVSIRRLGKKERTFDSLLGEFDEFVFENLGVFLARFRHMAILYFAGRLDKWIRVQRNSNPDRALAALVNCAWDLHLGNIYQEILAVSPEHSAVLSHFCTRERELALFLATSQLLALKICKTAVYPYYEYELGLYEEAIGNGWRKSLMLADLRAKEFVERRNAGIVKVQPSRLPHLLSDARQTFVSALSNN